jgi:hypothetical protein
MTLDQNRACMCLGIHLRSMSGSHNTWRLQDGLPKSRLLQQSGDNESAFHWRTFLACHRLVFQLADRLDRRLKLARSPSFFPVATGVWHVLGERKTSLGDGRLIPACAGAGHLGHEVVFASRMYASWTGPDIEALSSRRMQASGLIIAGAPNA